MSTEALQRAIKLAGGQTGLADRIGKRQSTVRGWLVRMRCVPPDAVIPVSAALDYEITPHELRPDIYPHAEDGLPARLRRQSA